MLVVEDEPDIRETVAEALAEGGYIVETAANGAEGLTRALSTHPDVIVLDLMMPVMDGLTFLAAKKSDDRIATVPVVVETAVREPVGVEACEVLQKPFGLDELMHAVERCLTPRLPRA